MRIGIKGWIGIGIGVLSIIGIILGCRDGRKRGNESIQELEKEVEQILEQRKSEAKKQMNSIVKDYEMKANKTMEEVLDRKRLYLIEAAKAEMDWMRSKMKNDFGDDCDEEAILKGMIMEDGRTGWDWIEECFAKMGLDNPIKSELEIDP